MKLSEEERRKKQRNTDEEEPGSNKNRKKRHSKNTLGVPFYRYTASTKILRELGGKKPSAQ